MLDKNVKEIIQMLSSVVKAGNDAVMPSRQQFTRLLSSPAATRKVPGIPVHLNENDDYVCSNQEAKETRGFLMQLYKIDSKESLINYQKVAFRPSVEYEQFMTFWKEAPLFDLGELNADGRKLFESRKEIAAAFYPLLQEKGFYAWDISEYIFICRIAKACGIINETDFDEIVDRFVRKAQAFYHSYGEYAASYICGALYFSASNFGTDGVDDFFEIQKNVLAYLFDDEDGVWFRYSWYVPEEREWADIYPGNTGGCLITKAAFEKGIEYMYHEEPAAGQPDNGWRFFHGDEDEEYANDPSNVQIVGLNTICNLNPTILAFLEAPADTAYAWNGKDWILET